jgi:hypothetical protein
MSEKYYYVNSLNEVVGPNSMEELLKLKANGTIQDSTLVAAEGSSGWTPLSKLIADSKPNPISLTGTEVMQTPYKGAQASILAKYMPLESGEYVLCDLQGNAYNLSPNIFARLAALFEKLFSIVLGCPKTAHVIVTNKRIIVVEFQKMFWVFLASASAKSVMPRSIGSTGYRFARSLIFFRSHYLEFIQGNSGTLVKSAKGKGRVYEVIRCIVSLADKVTIR